MGYTRETTHFGFPLADGSDLTTPMDYNQSLEEADTALFEARTNATGAVGTAGNALTVANEAKAEAQSATSAAASATATAQAAATAANAAVAEVAEAKDDALDMICAVVEETATAQYKHEPTKDGLNYYFRYNDILYKTTVVINVGETIVPNTNCAATNVATELAIEAPQSAKNIVDVSAKISATTGITVFALLDTDSGIIDIAARGHGSLPNETIVLTLDADIALDINDGVLCGFGMATDGSTGYAFAVGRYSTANRTISVVYSSALTAGLVEYRLTAKIAE